MDAGLSHPGDWQGLPFPGRWPGAPATQRAQPRYDQQAHGVAARRLEALAQAEAAAGHTETALDFYFQATVLYAGAQHVIFQNNDDKRYLYAGVRRCYDQVIALAPYRIEHIDIPWNGTLVSGNLHLCPNRTSAPLVFYIPGCDTLKEAWPHPFFNAAHQRGMHVF